MKQRIYTNHTEFIPTEELVLAKPIKLKTEEKTDTGIVLAIRKESVIERPTYGEVIAVGDGCKNAKIGKIVFWDMQGGLDLEFEDGEYILIKDKTIIGTMKD